MEPEKKKTVPVRALIREGIISQSDTKITAAEKISPHLGRKIPETTIKSWFQGGIPEDTYYRIVTEAAIRRGELVRPAGEAEGPEEDDRQLPLWMNPEWRKRRTLTKVIEQVRRLFFRTKGEGAEWARLDRALDRLEAWRDEDWREIAEGDVDYIATDVVELRKKAGEG